MTQAVNANASSMEALGRQYESIAHNLANANTTGYKRLLSTLMWNAAQGTPAAAGGTRASGSGGGEIPPGLVVGKTFVDFGQGAMVETGRPLDLALHGKGFFVLETPQGELYTRNGTFQVNAQGQLVDSSGRTVAGEGGPIVIPKTAGALDVSVSQDGRIMAGKTAIGRLRIVEFEKPEVLTPAGECAFRAPAGAAPAAATKTSVQQGFQEASNVSVVEELVGLITVSRLYEANASIMQKRGENTKTLLQVAMA